MKTVICSKTQRNKAAHLEMAKSPAENLKKDRKLANDIQNLSHILYH